MNNSRLPTLFVSHGGGPWPYIDEMKRLFEKTAMEFSKIPQTLPFAPDAILVISGHWEEPEFTVATSAHPPMVYDYSGFPEHTYHIKYPAPGSLRWHAGYVPCSASPVSKVRRIRYVASITGLLYRWS